jgi:hypothetical protein
MPVGGFAAQNGVPQTSIAEAVNAGYNEGHAETEVFPHPL